MPRESKRVQAARMEINKGWLDRRRTLARLMSEGHVCIVEDNNPAAITVQVGTEVFSDRRESFPTELLMARMQLAVSSGQSAPVRSTAAFFDLADTVRRAKAITAAVNLKSQVGRQWLV